MRFKRKDQPTQAGEPENEEDGYVDLPKVSAFPVASGEATTLTQQHQVSPPYLEVRLGFLAGQFPLRDETIRIGRGDTDQQFRPDVDLGSDDAVSRRHAEIRRRGNRFVLVDLGSTNGTLLNGEYVVPHVEMPLTNNDEIRLGAMCLIKVHL
jgi:hypothetical protein